jgi:predicted PurR-regulated permease PerM
MLKAGEESYTTLQRVSVMFNFVLISVIFLWLVRGFILAVVMAAIFAGLTHPLYTRVLTLFRGRRAAAAMATLIVVVLLVVIPVAFFAQMVAVEAFEIGQSVRPQVAAFIQDLDEPGASLEWIPFWDRLEPYREQITTKLGEGAGALSSLLVNGLSAAAQGTLRFFLQLFIMLYSMFFFLTHGREARDQVMRLTPFKESDKKLLLGTFLSVSRATIKGTLIIGIIQGGLAGLAFAVVGIEGAIFWGAVMAVLSVVPAIGTARVWLPAAVYLFAVGQTVPAIGLFLWCAIVVGTADNLLRPVLVGRDTEMPDLMVLLSTFGGLALFGVVGLVIGPVIAALFLAMWKIYSDTFGDLLLTPKEVADEA